MFIAANSCAKSSTRRSCRLHPQLPRKSPPRRSPRREGRCAPGRGGCWSIASPASSGPVRTAGPCWPSRRTTPSASRRCGSCPAGNWRRWKSSPAGAPGPGRASASPPRWTAIAGRTTCCCDAFFASERWGSSERLRRA